MAGSSITSVLDIKLIDDVSVNAAKIAGALKRMEAEALEVDAALGKSGASEKFQANLKRIGAQVPHIEAVSAAWKSYAQAEGLAESRGEWTAQQAASVKNWERINVSSIKAVMSQERAHAAVQAQQAERAEQLSRRQFEQQTQLAHRAMEQRDHQIGHHGVVNYALQSAAMAVGAGEVVNVGKEAWQQGAELSHERIQLRNAGRTPEEMAQIEAAGRNAVAAMPTAGMTEAMKVIAETTAAFGSVHHAIDNLPFMMKTMSVLKASGGEHIQGDAGTVGRYFAKTFEERQTRPENFEKEARQMIPAMVASGGTFNPQELYAFAQQAKSALPSLSMRFLSKIAPSLIGAQGGDRAGTGLNAFESVISGKANDKKQAEEWMKLGLLDPKQAIMKAGHATSWKSGAVKDTFLAMTDPLAWSEKYLIPALQKQGIDPGNREAVKMVLDTMFRNQNANMFASEITQAASRQRLHKDEGLYSQAGSLEEIYNRDLGDFGVAAGALGGALKNLAAAATAPMMHNAASSLSWLAGELNSLSKFGFEHPTIAATTGVGVGAAALGGAGYMGMQLMNGFGLGTSAKALDAAAAHLMEVSATGGLGKAAGEAPGVPGEASPGYTNLTGRGLFMGLNMAMLAAGMGDRLKAAETDNTPVDASVSREASMGDAVRNWFSNRPAEAAYRPEQSIPLRVPPSEVTNFDGNALRRNDEMPARVIVNSPPPPSAVTDFDGDALRRDDGPPVDRRAGWVDPRRTLAGYMDYARPVAAAGEMPAATPPPRSGVPGPADAPKVDTSSLDAAGQKAAEIGQAIHTALNVTASPQVDTSGISAAEAAVDRLAAKLAALGAQAAAAAASISGAGGGSTNAGAIRAASNRQFAGAGRIG